MPIEKSAISSQMKRTTVYLDIHKHQQLKVHLTAMNPPMTFSEWVCEMIDRQLILINQNQLDVLKAKILD